MYIRPMHNFIQASPASSGFVITIALPIKILNRGLQCFEFPTNGSFVNLNGGKLTAQLEKYFITDT